MAAARTQMVGAVAAALAGAGAVYTLPPCAPGGGEGGREGALAGAGVV